MESEVKKDNGMTMKRAFFTLQFPFHYSLYFVVPYFVHSLQIKEQQRTKQEGNGV